jgi:predicted O-methyltransferase YrrM
MQLGVKDRKAFPINYDTERLKNIPEWRADKRSYLNYPWQKFGSSGERHLIYRLARDLGSGNYGDIGVLRGTSTVCMAYGLQDSNSTGTIYSVDFFGSVKGSDNGHIPEQIKTHFIDNKLRASLEICKGDSSTVGKSLDIPFKMVFIDGDHTYDGCKKDFDAWGRLIQKGGVVAFHDTNFDTVDTVINEMDKTKWEFLYHIYTTRAFRRK